MHGQCLAAALTLALSACTGRAFTTGSPSPSQGSGNREPLNRASGSAGASGQGWAAMGGFGQNAWHAPAQGGVESTQGAAGAWTPLAGAPTAGAAPSSAGAASTGGSSSAGASAAGAAPSSIQMAACSSATGTELRVEFRALGSREGQALEWHYGVLLAEGTDGWIVELLHGSCVSPAVSLQGSAIVASCLARGHEALVQMRMYRVDWSSFESSDDPSWSPCQ